MVNAGWSGETKDREKHFSYLSEVGEKKKKEIKKPTNRKEQLAREPAAHNQRAASGRSNSASLSPAERGQGWPAKVSLQKERLPHDRMRQGGRKRRHASRNFDGTRMQRVE